MSDALAKWERRQKPATLSRRLAFADYAATRQFLDRLADLCEAEGLHPNISFGTTYVSLTIEAQGDAGVGAREEEFASKIEGLVAD